MSQRTMPAPRQMPECPVCGQPVNSFAWLLIAERPDDGRRGICKFMVMCKTDGARWKWADRPDDDWAFDQVSTDYFAKRLAETSEHG